MIPPPVVASVYAKPGPAQSSLASPRQPDDQLSFFRRKQKQLESDVQILLDAQADALLSGLNSSPGEDDTVSTGSNTPTAFTSNSPSIQRHSKIGLRQARKGLYTAMRRLALLKAEELDDITLEVEESTAITSQLEEWERKKERLEERRLQIHQSNQYRKVQELRQQADDMQPEINQLEAKLTQMKIQQKKLRKEASDSENEIQARLSSYTSTLAMLDKKSSDLIMDYKQQQIDSRQAGLEADTLEAVRRSLSQEHHQLQDRQRLVQKEQEALEEGAAVWKQVWKDVSDFECKLRDDMARLTPNKTKSPSRAAQVVDNKTDDSATGIGELLAQLEQTTTQLKDKYKLAQTRDWNLLVAAIGAELEAFLKGKEILTAALGESTEKNDDRSPPATSDLSDQTALDANNQSIYDDFRTPRSSVIRHVDDEQALRDLDQAFDGGKGSGDTVASSDTDPESDGPDHDLLVSRHHDTDTE